MTARQLALAEIDQAVSANATIIAANVRPMEATLALADELDEDAMLRMHPEQSQRHCEGVERAR